MSLRALIPVTDEGVALGLGIGVAVGLGAGVAVGEGRGTGVAVGDGLGVGVGEDVGTTTERGMSVPLTRSLEGRAGGEPLRVKPTVMDPPAGMEAFQEAGVI